MGMITKEYHEGYQQGFKDAKADYENRLKTDMVAMLEELKKEVEENLEDNYSELDEIQGALRAGRLIENVGCVEIIQQKINSLKEA